MAGARIPNSINSVEPVYVLDTQVWVWLLEANRRLSKAAKAVLLDRRSRLAVPSYCFEEMAQKFPASGVIKNNSIRIPPTPALKLAIKTFNIRVIPRGSYPAIAQELRLKSLYQRKNVSLEPQDIPIAAVVLALRAFFPFTILISTDAKLRNWAAGLGIKVV